MTVPSTSAPTLAIRRATLSDLQRVVVLEHDCFASPWPTWMIRQELAGEDSVWLVAESGGEVAGYLGLRMAAEEGHVSTVGVATELRGQGLGEALMLAALDLALRCDCDCVVLEYRIGNEPAARLYAKLGFERTRIRRGYYQDNGEDAVEVILPELLTTPRREALADLFARWEVQHGQPVPRVQ